MDSAVEKDGRDDQGYAYKIDIDHEKAATQLVVGRNVGQPVVLEMGPMHEPLSAMRACGRELYTVWGLDPDQQENLSRELKPIKSPKFWINSDDYPTKMVQQFKLAVVHFRLAVNESGEATACHIQNALGDDEFERAVCRNMMATASFLPALDATGKPVPSAFVSTVSFVMW